MRRARRREHRPAQRRPMLALRPSETEQLLAPAPQRVVCVKAAGWRAVNDDALGGLRLLALEEEP
ncbi:MAG: hypothetical protein ACOZQL_38805 [Myxococcota bacterium]